MSSNTLSFVHGFLGHPSDWDRVREGVDGPSQSLAIPDSRTWTDAIQRLSAAMQGPVDLVGYSMGGRLAIGCAAAAHATIKRLIIVSANPGIDKHEQSRRQQHDRHVASRLRQITTKSQLSDFLNHWYRQDVFAGLTESHVAKLVDRRRDVDTNRMANLIEALTVAEQPDYRNDDNLRSIRTLFVAGERDTKYSAIAKATARLSSQFSCEIIPDCGHAIPSERPAHLAATINAFLQT